MKIKEPKILCLFSAPLVSPDGQPLSALDVEAEKSVISSELASINKELTLRLRPATIDELALGISDEYNILHISGHGNKDYLLFEDGKGGSQLITGEYLKELISVGGPFELAIISACHSENIGKLVNEAGVRHVVAIKNQHPVLDKAAITFIGQFFRNIFREESVQKSFELAKLMIKGNPELSKLSQELEYIADLESVEFVKEEDKFILLPDGESSFHLDPLIEDELPLGGFKIDYKKLPQTNITSRPQGFTGRSVEIKQIINEIYQNKLVTITGAGGIGKTMVAMEVARWFHARAHFPDGIFYVDLRKTENTEALISLIGLVCGFQAIEVHDITKNLKDKNILLYLDNAEDLLWEDEDGTKKIIDEILKFTSKVKLLVTSQRTVGGSLFAPERNIRLYSLENNFSAQLFFHFTKRQLTKEDLENESFNKLLSIIGGHPLTIVITARQLGPGKTIDYLINRIEENKAEAVELKKLSERDPEHGESLVASLSSAYNFLSDKSKEIFQILSLLPAGVDKFTIDDLFGSTAWGNILEIFETGLAEMIEGRRVYLLPSIQLFASVISSKEIKAKYCEKIITVYGDYSELFYSNLRSPEHKKYEYFFSVELPNFLSIIKLDSLPPESPKQISGLGFMSTHIIQILIVLYRYSEGIDIGLAVLPILNRIKDRWGEANTLQALGDIAVRTDDLKEAKLKCDEALKIYKEIDDKLGEANTLRALGDLAVRTDDLKEAKRKYDEVLKIYKEIDDKLGEANTQRALGGLAVRTNDLKEAKLKYDEALKIYKEIDDKLGEANTLQALGDLAVRTDDLKEAKLKYDEALKIFKEIESKLGEANTFQALGDLAVRTDDLKEANLKYDEALKIFKEIEANLGEAYTHKAFGNLAVRTSDLKEAKLKYDEALKIFKEIDDKLGEANTQKALGYLAVWTDDLKEANLKYDEALKIFKEIDDKLGEANAQRALGDLAVRTDDLKEARLKYDEALKIFKEIDDKLGEANTQKVLGDLAVRTDDLKEAKLKYDEALKIFKEIESKLGEANTFQALGDLAVRTDYLKEAKLKYDEALKIFKEIESKLGEANTLISLGQLNVLEMTYGYAFEQITDAKLIYNDIKDSEGIADSNRVLSFYFASRNDKKNCLKELDDCFELCYKINYFGSIADWLLFYANHFIKNKMAKESILFLEYSEKFALESTDIELINRIKKTKMSVI